MTGTDLMPNGAVPETFTGTNGTTINSTNWSIPTNQGSGGSAQIQGNQGRIRTGTTAFNRTSIRCLLASRADTEVVFDYVIPTGGDNSPSFWIRSVTAMDTASGYFFSLDASAMIVGYSTVATPYTQVTLTTYTHSLTAGQIARTRIAVFGSSIKMRVWLASGSEPTSTWHVILTDSHVSTAGFFGFTTSSSSTGSKDFFIDNVDAFDTVTPSQATINPTGSITPAGSLLKSTNKKFLGGITPSGALQALKAVPKLFTGTITPAGVLKKSMPKPFVGTITPAGALKKSTTKKLAGVIVPSGVFSKVFPKKFVGVIAPVGSVTIFFAGKIFGYPGLLVMSIKKAADIRARFRKG